MIRLSACSALLALLIVTSTAVGSQELNLLGTLDPCDCNYPPFNWSYSDVWGFAANGSEFAVLGSSLGVYIIDVTNPAVPVVASFVPGPQSNWRDMKHLGDYVFSVSEASGGMQVIDVSNPYAAFDATRWGTTAHNLYIDETTQRAYLFGVGNNNPILDISNPLAPTQIGDYSDRYLHDGYVKDGILYGAKIYNDAPHGSGLYILDVTNPASIDTVTIVTWPNAVCHNVWTNEDATIAVTTDETQGGHLRIWDITDLGAVLPDGEYTATGAEARIIHNAFIQEGLVYISYYWEGVRVVDISDPQNPVESYFYDTTPGTPPATYGGTWGVYPFLPSGRILASDVETGLYIFESVRGTAGLQLDPVAASERQVLRGVFPNPFNPATTISLLTNDSSVPLRVAIYDVHGRLVRSLHHGRMSAGEHRLRWNGDTDAGQTTASGVYYLRVTSPTGTETEPLALIK